MGYNKWVKMFSYLSNPFERPKNLVLVSFKREFKVQSTGRKQLDSFVENIDEENLEIPKLKPRAVPKSNKWVAASVF
jgi:hypothetical protein